MKTREEVGATLRRLRGNRTLKEAAAAIGISWRTLQSYETGARSPRDTKKALIADYYGAKVADIFF